MNTRGKYVTLRLASACLGSEVAGCEMVQAIQPEVEGAAVRRTLDAAWLAIVQFDCDEILRSAGLLAPFLEQSNDRVDPAGREEIQTLIAIGHLWHDDVHSAIALASAALDHRKASRFRSTLRTVLRCSRWRNGQFEMFYKLHSPRSYRSYTNAELSHVVNLSIEAAVEAEQLRFRQAERLAREAIELSRRVSNPSTPASLLATCVLASLAYEIDAIDEADLLIHGKATAIEQHGLAETAALGFTIAANIALTRGNVQVALLTLQKAQGVGIRRGWRRLVIRTAAEEIAVHIKQGRVDLAEIVLAKTNDWNALLTDQCDPERSDGWPLELARQRVDLANGDYLSAARGLKPLREAASKRSNLAIVARLTALRAGSLFLAGHKEDAQTELFEALRIGADTGLFRTFVEEMPIIEPCLRYMRVAMRARLDRLDRYIGSLLAASGTASAEKKKTYGSPRVTELLTSKETIILRLISLGLSNKSIARELCIAPETVKSHAKRIFMKLSTKTRAEAVARANDLGII